MADFDSIKVAARQHIEEIPEHVEYPSLRIGLENIDKGDKICVTIQVKDSKDVVKFEASHKLIMKEYPEGSKVIGRGVLNLVEINKE